MSNLIEKLPKVQGEYRSDAALKTWFDVGGNAEVLFKPKDVTDLVYFLKNRPKDVDVNILGAGSNVIIADQGVKGVVIRLGRGFTEIYHEDGKLFTGSSVLCMNLIQYCQNNDFGGLEFLSGIPGCVGGAVAMNAGCYGSDISMVLDYVKAVDYEGNIKELKKDDLKLSYRRNGLAKDYIFVEACFDVVKAPLGEVAKKVEDFCKARQESQPIRAKTGGSTFKNPFPGDVTKKKAWQLIDEAGLRGKKIGGAKISEKHCNFMINEGGAKAQDLIDLGNFVRKGVKEQCDCDLEWEIKILGVLE